MDLSYSYSMFKKAVQSSKDTVVLQYAHDALFLCSHKNMEKVKIKLQSDTDCLTDQFQMEGLTLRFAKLIFYHILIS